MSKEQEEQPKALEFKAYNDFCGYKPQDHYDVLIIGAGINGAVSAAALAGRGYKVLVADKSDFGSYTSQESSYLVWGGIKYLENFEFRLVRKLCLSRNNLLRSFPTRIKEIRFFFPRSRKNPNGLLKLFLGTFVYWIFGNFFTHAPRLYGKKEIRQEEPNMKDDGYTGAVDYSDAYLPDGDARFVYNFIQSAANNGATTLNYTEVAAITKEPNGWQAQLNDVITGATATVNASAVLNCGGPFVDGNNRQFGVNSAHRHIFSKGVHLVVPRLARRKRVITLFSDDNRMFFILPMGNKSCLGTTDTRVEELPPVVTDEDRDFILNQINDRMNLDRPLTKKDIISEKCGVRPLAVSASNGQNKDAEWTTLSRKHITEYDSEKNYLSIFGGKLTDCLNVGNEVVQIIRQQFKIKSQNTARTWYGEPPKKLRRDFMNSIADLNLEDIAGHKFNESIAKRLWRRYGLGAYEIVESIRQDRKMGQEIMPGSEVLRAEVYFSAKYEQNRTLMDFFRRRTLAWLLIGQQAITENTAGLQEIAQILFESNAEQALARFANAPMPAS